MHSICSDPGNDNAFCGISVLCAFASERLVVLFVAEVFGTFALFQSNNDCLAEALYVYMNINAILLSPSDDALDQSLSKSGPEEATDHATLAAGNKTQMP